MGASSPSAVPASITVIIPTYNRCAVLADCLRALAAQTVPPERVEIIVGDDGSTDATSATVTAARERMLSPIHYFRGENSGPGAARNRGLAMASAPIALIINDDTILDSAALAAHLEAHRREPAREVAVLGRVTISPRVPPSIFSPLHLDAAFSTFSDRRELGWKAFITANISVKPDFLLAHGLFEIGMFPHEDLELGERLRHHGLRVVYEPSALGYHQHCLTEADFLRAAERDGRALAHWYRKSPRLQPLLEEIGLWGPPPLRRAFRHVLADAGLAGPGRSIALTAGRALAPVNGRAARVLYKKLYQLARGAAIGAELARTAGDQEATRSAGNVATSSVR
jgi:GT2 family glycosyltransferase